MRKQSLLSLLALVLLLSTSLRGMERELSTAENASLELLQQNRWSSLLPEMRMEIIQKLIEDEKSDFFQAVKNILNLRLLTKNCSQILNDEQTFWEKYFSQIAQLLVQKKIVTRDNALLLWFKFTQLPATPPIGPTTAKWIITLLKSVGIKIDEPMNIGNYLSLRNPSALILAAENGNTNVVRALLEAGANVGYDEMHHWGEGYNYDEVRGWNALLAASKRGHIGTVELLLNHGANINYIGDNQATPLVLAAENGHSELVKFFISRGAQSCIEGKNRPLRYAAENGHIEVVRVLLECHPESEDFDRALRAASANCHSEMVELLLQYGVKKWNNVGWSALMLAVERGYLPVVQKCIDAHVFFTKGVYGKYNRTRALEMAVYHKRYDMAKLLISAGATLETDASWYELVRMAITYKDLNLVRWVFEGQLPTLNVDEQDNHQKTLLMLAIRRKNLDDGIIKYLLEQGADINTLKDNKGKTALDLVPNRKVRKLLEDGFTLCKAIRSARESIDSMAPPALFPVLSNNNDDEVDEFEQLLKKYKQDPQE